MLTITEVYALLLDTQLLAGDVLDQFNARFFAPLQRIEQVQQYLAMSEAERAQLPPEQAIQLARAAERLASRMESAQSPVPPYRGASHAQQEDQQGRPARTQNTY